MKLLRELSHPSAEVQRHALRKVAELGLPEYIEPLLDALGKPELRQLAIEALTPEDGWKGRSYARLDLELDVPRDWQKSDGLSGTSA